MSANPIDKNTTPKTTGSLEELFRHHLGEEAAVPARPMLWDQIDNSLLIRQNETYRRRLVVTRWVAAASLLLATLAGTGWWARRDAALGRAEVANTASRATTGTDHSAATNRGLASSGQRSTGAGEQLGSAGASAIVSPSANIERATGTSRNTDSEGSYAANSVTPGTGFGAASVRRGLANSPADGGIAERRSAAEPVDNSTAGFATVKEHRSGAALAARSEQAATRATDMVNTSGVVNTLPIASKGALAAGGTPAVGLAGAAGAAGAGAASAILLATTTSAPTVAEVEALGLLATRSAALSLSNPASLPNGLAALALPEPTPVPNARQWHFGGSYTAGIFNPNVNFSRAGIEPEFDYNPALGQDSRALTEAAATQYREHLRPGLSQRISLLASRHLAGRWSLSTGAEFSQANAKSATTASFVGEQLYDLGPYTNGPMQTTNFRYRTAGIPIAISYSNPIKLGWSLYGRLGGVVSALLGARSEVTGDPEATKTYSFISAGTPYRRMLGSVRGAAGAQFRPAVGNWALTLGPVAEMGLVPLNSHPAQSYLAQSRPYSFGLEASMEFGR